MTSNQKDNINITDKNSEGHKSADKTPDSAFIKSHNDNQIKALAERRDQYNAHAITGHDAKTGKKQESFTIVDGDTEHKTIRTPNFQFDAAAASDTVGKWATNIANVDKQLLSQLNPRDGMIRDGAPTSGPADVGWTVVDLAKERPAINQLLNGLENQDYNCKFYVKAYIEGKIPGDKDRANCHLDEAYLKSKHFHKQEITKASDLKEGDIIMLKVPSESGHIDPVMHAAVVMKDKDGHLYIIQKPDPILGVQKCSLQDFANHFSKEYTQYGHQLTLPGPYVDVYRRS